MFSLSPIRHHQLLSTLLNSPTLSWGVGHLPEQADGAGLALNLQDTRFPKGRAAEHALVQLLEMQQAGTEALTSLPQTDEWLHPALPRAFPTRLSVFPSQGIQEDQPQQQGECMHGEQGPCRSAHGAGHAGAPLVWL